MKWFEKLAGFVEKTPQQVRQNITITENILNSRVNGSSYKCGILTTPSLADLRRMVLSNEGFEGTLSLCETIADVQTLHKDEKNAGALIQVASQFNLLEMISPSAIPEEGVTKYENDPTQGPACAIAAGAGTIYRNYFVRVNGEIGQSVDNQIDCLADIGIALGNIDNQLWEMKNGYALATTEGLKEIKNNLERCTEIERDGIRQLLRIGIQTNTEVTIGSSAHAVTQAFCSALPIAYNKQPLGLWSPFAQLILEASYEATICAAILNSEATGNSKVFLTLVGGGVFGNNIKWILAAIRRSIDLYRHFNLDVAIVSRGHSNKYVQELITSY